jgi:hypothetical protein
VTFDEATDRLLALARDSEGVVTASQVEDDPLLAEDQRLVSAAARMLAGSTNVFGTARASEDEGWFPFEELRFTDLRAAGR